jgi:hypothetical protein
MSYFFCGAFLYFFKQPKFPQDMKYLSREDHTRFAKAYRDGKKISLISSSLSLAPTIF